VSASMSRWQVRDTCDEQVPAPASPYSRRYLISVSSLNIGRYIEMTIVPTMAPTPIIRIGSMMDVND